MNRHEPQESFVNRLEAQIGAEARKRNREVAAQSWKPRSRWVFVTATAAVVLVSMALGGAAVALAYQSQSNEQRAILVDTYSRKLQIARQRVELASKVLSDSQVKVQMGAVATTDAMENALKVKEAEAQVTSIALQLEEVRLTGQEPATSVSAPAAGGRDFLAERWMVDLSMSRAAIEFERARLQNLQRRVDVGAADPSEAQASRVRLTELEATIDMIQHRIEIRRQFIAHTIDATMANLRVLEAEGRQSLQTLRAKIEFARASVDLVEKKFKAGAAQQVEVLQAQLHLQELQADIAKAELELALVLKQLARGK